jgi:hypothetical protein
MPRYRIAIEADTDCESPAECECTWHPYSFNRHHINHRSPDEFFDDNGRPRLWLRNKLRVGLAFVLSYHEHGLCLWFLQGTKYTPDAQWDTTGMAGVLVWEDPPDHIGGKTYDERKEDAESFLESYTDWCNGDCHGYVIEKSRTCALCAHDDWEEIDSCWGFCGDYIAEAVKEAIPEDATEENTTIEGDGAYLVEGKLFDRKGAVHA